MVWSRSPWSPPPSTAHPFSSARRRRSLLLRTIDPGNATIDQIEIEGGGAAARLLAAATASGMRRSASTRTGAGGRIGNGRAMRGHPREIREKFNLWEHHGVPSLWSLGRPAGARRSPGLSVAARRG